MDIKEIESILERSAQVEKAAGDIAWGKMDRGASMAFNRFPCVVYMDDDQTLVVEFQGCGPHEGQTREVCLTAEDLQGI